MRTLKNMATAIIAIVFAIVLPSSKVDGQNATTDTISTTLTAGKIDGFRWSENYHGRTQVAKIPGELQISLDVSFASPITLRYDTINGGSNGTITDSLTSPFITGPKTVWVRRVWRDSTGLRYSNVVMITTLVNPKPPVINFITVPNQISANTVLSGLSITTNTKTYYRAFISTDSITWIGVGDVDTIYAINGIQTFTKVDSLKGDYSNWYVRYCAWNSAGADSTIFALVSNLPNEKIWVELDSARQIGTTSDFKLYGRAITYGSTGTIKPIYNIGDSGTVVLPAYNGVQYWTATKTNATKGVLYTITAIAKNSAGSSVSTNLVQITIPIDLSVTGFSATPSTMSAQVKFKPEVPVGKVANFSVDIAKDSSFVNVAQSKAFSGMTSSSQIQSAIFTLDTGVYYARVQGYISATGQSVKEVISFTIKANVTGIEEESKKFLVIYPNPANDILNVPSFDTYIITNIQGQILKTITTDNDLIINVSDLTRGYYIIKNEKGQFKKFLKN